MKLYVIHAKPFGKQHSCIRMYKQCSCAYILFMYVAITRYHVTNDWYSEYYYLYNKIGYTLLAYSTIYSVKNQMQVS